jgi:hypothetical protein
MMVACPTCVKISKLAKDLLAARLGFEEMNAQVEEIKKQIVKAPAQYPSTRYGICVLVLCGDLDMYLP